ncbi:hypothetical protein GQ53DRAFT_838873 [Thozetella sp. PMI_491]|nr:hypothetical protein GQ53DRAFT_838873 [Thozetella sp. PMI_491]
MASEDDRTDDGASSETKKPNFLKKLLHLGRKSSEKALAEKRDAAEKGLFDNPSELDASTRAWARAYEGLRTKTMAESSLAKFSLGLTPDAFGRANAHTATRISSLKAVTSSAQNKANKHAKLEGHIVAVGEFGKKMQDTISAALTAYPLAGMAWSGLCAVAPYIAQPLSSRKDMRDGLQHVIDQLGWYMDLVRVLLRSSWEKGEEFAQLQKTPEACVVQLYEKLVLYQVHVVVEVFHTNKLVKLIKVYLGQTNWAQEIEDIKNLEQSVVKRISEGLKVEVAEHLRGLSSHVVSIDETLLRIEKGAEEGRIREAVERHGDLIGKFKAIDYEYTMKMNPLRVEGTCEWICQHPGFKSWPDGPDKMLLVSADPGCGKSVLARYLVEDFLPRQKPESAVCYFFFKEQLKPENREQTVALCAILHSLFTQRPLLVDACNKAVREAGNRLQSDFTALWDIFEKVVTDKTAGPVLVVLDALDECNPKERERLLGWINILLSRPEKASGVKFLCTTRGYPRIADLFDALGTSKVRLSGEDKINAGKIQKEIGLVVEHRLKELAKPPKSLVESQIQSIRNALGSNGQTQRTYLWVKLMFDALEEELDNAADDIATLVAKLPQTLSGVYETLLRRVKSDDFDAVQIVLRLVIAANRPLTLRELNTALKVRGKIGVKNEAALHLVPDDNFRR